MSLLVSYSFLYPHPFFHTFPPTSILHFFHTISIDSLTAKKMLSHFSATDVSMSHNDERWHSTELTETGSATQRPQETGSNQGWAVQATYSWGDLGRQKMAVGKMEKWKEKKKSSDSNCRQHEGMKYVLTSSITGGQRERSWVYN